MVDASRGSFVRACVRWSTTPRGARKLDVGMTHERACSILPERHGGQLRLSFANMSEEEISRGFALLVQAIQDIPMSLFD